MRIRAATIILDGDQVILMHRIHKDKKYYTFPGGGLEPGETVKQAALREAGEETSLEVAIGRLLSISPCIR